MGRHTGFLLCLAMLSIVVAGQFGIALTAVDPLGNSAGHHELLSVSVDEQSSAAADVNRGSQRFRTIHVSPNSLLVITSLDTTGSPHTFHLRSERTAVPPGDSARNALLSGANNDDTMRVAAIDDARDLVDSPRSTQRKPRPATIADSDRETASFDLENSPQKVVGRRFIAPRYGNNSVSDVMVAGSLLAEDSNVAIYLDQSLPDELKVALRSRSSILSPGLVSQLVKGVSEHLGPIHDLDQDGRLSVLITELDCQSDNESVPVLGCVRPSDFMGTDSNAAEMADIVYLDHRLPSGNDLIALLSHELAHASVYCRLRDRVVKQKQPIEIPEWLHEGIAHYVERQFAEDTSVFLERREQFYQTPHRFPVCSSPTVSSRSDRRGGSRAAVARFLEFGIRREPLRQALLDAENLETLLASCLRDDLQTLLPAWSLLEAEDIYWTTDGQVHELNFECSITQEVLGTAFTVVKSGAYPVRLELSCEDDSEWTALTVAISESPKSTELSMTRSVE